MHLSFKGELHTDFRTQYVIMTQTRRPLAFCHMRRSRIIILILRNLIAVLGMGSLKRGLVFHIKFINLGEVLIVGESRIHQRNSWYYLGRFQTSKAEL